MLDSVESTGTHQSQQPAHSTEERCHDSVAALPGSLQRSLPAATCSLHVPLSTLPVLCCTTQLVQNLCLRSTNKHHCNGPRKYHQQGLARVLCSAFEHHFVGAVRRAENKRCRRRRARAVIAIASLLLRWFSCLRLGRRQAMAEDRRDCLGPLAHSTAGFGSRFGRPLLSAAAAV
jgi:hypothetical protein